MRRAVAVLGVIVVLAAGCSGTPNERSSASPSTSRRATPITDAQASMLADVLVTNHGLGGSAVVATVPYGTVTFQMAGEIDWANHVGRLTIRTEPKQKGTAVRGPFDVAFDQKVTFEQVAGLADALVAQGRPPANWVATALDPGSSPLHVVLQLILGLSSTQRDNPVLLRQDVTYGGALVVRGSKTDRFEMGRSTYAVDRASGRLVQVTASLETTHSTATIDLSDPGPRTIPLPAADDIVALSDVRDIYAKLTAPS